MTDICAAKDAPRLALFFARLVVALAGVHAIVGSVSASEFDIVIAGGRIIDPETGFDTMDFGA